MKALSVRQPWAWLIIHGGKDVENRTWNFVPKLRERIFIHASKGMTRDEYATAWAFAHDVWKNQGSDLLLPAFGALERGGIVGCVEIIGYLDNDAAKEEFYPWYHGDLGIVLHDPRPCIFTPCKGTTFFFTPDPSQEPKHR